MLIFEIASEAPRRQSERGNISVKLLLLERRKRISSQLLKKVFMDIVKKGHCDRFNFSPWKKKKKKNQKKMWRCVRISTETREKNGALLSVARLVLRWGQQPVRSPHGT